MKIKRQYTCFFFKQVYIAKHLFWTLELNTYLLKKMEKTQMLEFHYSSFEQMHNIKRSPEVQHNLNTERQQTWNPANFCTVKRPSNLWFKQSKDPVSWTSRGLIVNTNREREGEWGAYEIYCAALPLTPFI